MSYSTADIVLFSEGGISLLALILNITTVCFLKGSFHGDSAKITAILHVILCNILISTGKLIITTLRFYNFTVERSRTAQVVWAFLAASYHLWFGMFFLLLIYRYTSNNSTTKNDARSPPTKCNLSITWCFGAILGIGFSVSDTLEIRDVYNSCLWLTFDGVFLILFFVTYARTFCTQGQTNPNSAEERRLYRLTAALCTAVLIFEVAPTIGNAFVTLVSSNIRGIFRHTIELLWVTNILMHPIICIVYKDRGNQVASTLVSTSEKQQTNFATS